MKKCKICNKEFVPLNPKQTCCSPTCSHLNSKPKQKYKRNKKQKKFKCPRCGKWHNEPKWSDGDYRQYCKNCRTVLSDIQDNHYVIHI